MKGKKTGGRKKGTPNKVTRELRKAIENAFVELGGESYLKRVARKNPGVFVQLLGKLLPLQITGKDGDPIKSETRVIDPAAEGLLRRIRERSERGAPRGFAAGDAQTDPDGSVLPAAVCSGTNGHGAPLDGGTDPGGAA